MINKDDLVSLPWEQKRKLSKAIEYGFLDNYEDNPREWKHSLVGSLLWRRPNRCSTVNRLKNIVGHIPTWEDMTDEVLRDFVDDTLEAVSMSSARTFCAELKAVINANRKKVPSEDYAKILSVKGMASQAVYLTREEIMRIIDYQPMTRQERYVRRNFLVEFMTGARRCDAERLTVNHCDIDTGTLSYVPKKTPGRVVTVPVDERLRLRDLLADNYKRDMRLSTFNRIVRKICQECHIDTMCTLQRRGVTTTEPKWKFVSSHTARRSFATNLYISGVSLEDIALLMGHGKNIETTKNYICAERNLSKAAVAYFHRQKEQSDNIDVRSYNKAIDDVLEFLASQDVIHEGSLTHRQLNEMKITEQVVIH